MIYRFKYRPLWHYYFENNDAVIYVIDSSDHERFDEAKEELWDLIKDDRLRDSALLVLANKQVIRIFATLHSNQTLSFILYFGLADFFP